MPLIGAQEAEMFSGFGGDGLLQSGFQIARDT